MGREEKTSASRFNDGIGARLEEVGALLESQGANRFRIEAYRRAAATLRDLDRPVSEILDAEGMEGLDLLRGIGPVLARAIRDLVVTGRLPMLERLRGESDPTALLASVPGIGAKLADRLHHDLGLSTLEELESAALDGRLETIPGIGHKKIAGIRDSLASRVGRSPRFPLKVPCQEPGVSELLDVDREYRSRALAGQLPMIAPRRFNPQREAWLPILHAERGPRHYTALFSNTARAHALGRTRDWVVLYSDGGLNEGLWTVVTGASGELRGQRIVRGREPDCLEYYKASRGSGSERLAHAVSGPAWSRP